MLKRSNRSVFDDKSWFSLPLFYLLITAALGVFLRTLQVWTIDVKFTNILHAHSHLALLGWASTALIVFLVNAFIEGDKKSNLNYRRIYYAFQFSIIGMLLFFPFQGYSITTIAFSSFYIIVSYVFALRFLKDTAARKHTSIAIKFARAGIYFFLISSIGPWSLGPLNGMGMGGSDLYFNMIYFYLHFLYNGWFLFGLFALAFAYLEQKQIGYNKTLAKWVLNLLSLSTLLAYSLSTLWVEPPFGIYICAFIAMIIQLIAIGLLIRLVLRVRNKLNFPSSLYCWLSYGIFTIFLCKILLQSASAIPALADEIAVRRDWVLAYLHLVFLGLLTPSIFLIQINVYMAGRLNALVKWGLVIFVLSFLINEALMIAKGFGGLIYGINEQLLFAALGLFVSVLILNIAFLSKNHELRASKEFYSSS